MQLPPGPTGLIPIEVPTLYSPRPGSGPRLKLRPFTLEDVDWVHQVSLDPEMRRWVPLPDPYRRSHAEFFVRGHALAKARSGQSAEFLIEDADSAERLGRVALHRRPESAVPTAEVGYWLGPDARGRGVMTKAVRTAGAWAFAAEGLNVQRLVWHALVGNLASRAVAERAGFTIHPGTTPHPASGRQKWHGEARREST
jgi:RimJ/RimL family protein N-acetyltransferase